MIMGEPLVIVTAVVIFANAAAKLGKGGKSI